MPWDGNGVGGQCSPINGTEFTWTRNAEHWNPERLQIIIRYHSKLRAMHSSRNRVEFTGMNSYIFSIKLKFDGFVKSQNFDFFCSMYHIEITSPEILFLCFLRPYQNLNSQNLIIFYSRFFWIKYQDRNWKNPKIFLKLGTNFHISLRKISATKALSHKGYNIILLMPSLIKGTLKFIFLFCVLVAILLPLKQ